MELSQHQFLAIEVNDRLTALLQLAEEQSLHQERFQAIADDTIHLTSTILLGEAPLQELLTSRIGHIHKYVLRFQLIIEQTKFLI